MRDARLVGQSSDAKWLIIEVDGEHLRLPLNDALRSAARHGTQLAMPLQASVSPREVQRRIRAGETAEHIAETSGVTVDLIARFEGPVLDERRWQAECARRTDVDGTSLEERFAVATHTAEGAQLAKWDAWVDPDEGGWRIQATCPDGRVAVWSWNARTSKLRGQDDLARFTLSGRVVSDDLEAVLRPLGGSGRGLRDPHGASSPAAHTRPADDARRSGPKRRTSVPSLDDILRGSTTRSRTDEAES